MNQLVPSIIPATLGVLELLSMEWNDLEFIVLGSNSCPVVNLLCNLKQINLSSLDLWVSIGQKGIPVPVVAERYQGSWKGQVDKDTVCQAEAPRI